MDAKHPRLRQAFREQLADSLRKPLPGLTRRQVFGAVRFPGKATAVVGMRRAGKTTFLQPAGRTATNFVYDRNYL